MPHPESSDILLAANQFLDDDGKTIDVTVYTGRRLDHTGKAVGHYIIEILGDDTITDEIPAGSRDIRHPSVVNGAREAWYINGDGFSMRFGPMPIESSDVYIDRLVLDGIPLHMIPPDVANGVTL